MNNGEIVESLRKVIVFLEENEQYGDEWGPELTVLHFLCHQFNRGEEK